MRIGNISTRAGGDSATANIYPLHFVGYPKFRKYLDKVSCADAGSNAEAGRTIAHIAAIAIAELGADKIEKLAQTKYAELVAEIDSLLETAQK